MITEGGSTRRPKGSDADHENNNNQSHGASTSVGCTTNHVSPVSTNTHNSKRSGCTSSGCCNNHAGLSFANFNNGTLSLDASDTDVSGLDDTAMIDDIMAVFIDEESIADLPGDIRAELLYDIEPTNEYGWIPEGYECSGRVIRNISLPNFLWLVQGWSAVNETTTYPSTTAWVPIGTRCTSP